MPSFGDIQNVFIGNNRFNISVLFSGLSKRDTSVQFADKMAVILYLLGVLCNKVPKFIKKPAFNGLHLFFSPEYLLLHLFKILCNKSFCVDQRLFSDV